MAIFNSYASIPEGICHSQTMVPSGKPRKNGKITSLIGTTTAKGPFSIAMLQ